MRANDEVAALVGRDHPAGGEYREVTEPSRLVFTTSALDAAGNVILEGLTTVTFEDLGTSTRMRLHTRATGTGERVPFMLAGMEQGWDESLMKLACATVSSDPAQAHARLNRIDHNRDFSKLYVCLSLLLPSPRCRRPLLKRCGGSVRTSRLRACGDGSRSAPGPGAWAARCRRSFGWSGATPGWGWGCTPRHCG